ncbi:MAG: arsenical pump-driving ATPase [bacterium]|nr:arsenical pump-driving ATPase [bacterium]
MEINETIVKHADQRQTSAIIALPSENTIPGDFLVEPPRFLFFTGKGGVGKTSLSCAAAVALADKGKKTLLVSTDPASNLGQVLGAEIASHPLPIDGANGLWALNIDPRQSAAEYRERVVGPYRGVLPDAAVKEIEEQLSGACTVEIAAFDEFSRLMTDKDAFSEFEHIVFDTAPTGHTLRLLNLSSAWKGYLESNSGSASCLGPMSGLKGQRQQFEDTLKNLTNDETTRLILVARPDKHSIAEAARTSRELANLGVNNQWFVINGMLDSFNGDDQVAHAMRSRETSALDTIPKDLLALPRTDVWLSPASLIGVSALRSILQPGKPVQIEPAQKSPEVPLSGSLSLTDLLHDLDRTSGIIMTMGKGGVGKTTLASKIAVELADRGAKVHLTTSDPAAHLDLSLATKHKNLRVSRIDPLVETDHYREETLRQAQGQLDDESMRLLEEDLHSPCTEEIAVFRAFAKVVDEAKDSIVVVDTAPTGHTILLLDATEAYHREVSRNRSSVPDEVKLLLPRLRDPNYTRIMIVTLPEATPVQEALDLQKDLERAGISPYAWIVNQSLSSLTVNHPILKAKRASEFKHINHVQEIATKMAIVPWQEANE